MSQLNVKLSQDRLEALRRYADRRRTPISWLIKDSIDYLLAGGEPLMSPASEAPSAAELAALVQHGGAFDWLADEPDLYSADDGEPVLGPDGCWPGAIWFSSSFRSLICRGRS